MTITTSPVHPVAAVCLICGAPISIERRRRSDITCSNECASAYMRGQQVASWYGKPVSTPTAGAIGELIVASDLLARGYEVFRAVSPSSSCDLMARAKNGRVLAIEVRGGRYTKGGRLNYHRQESDRADVWAVVVLRQPPEIVYLDSDGERLVDHHGVMVPTHKDGDCA